LVGVGIRGVGQDQRQRAKMFFSYDLGERFKLGRSLLVENVKRDQGEGHTKKVRNPAEAGLPDSKKQDHNQEGQGKKAASQRKQKPRVI